MFGSVLTQSLATSMSMWDGRQVGREICITEEGLGAG